MGGFLVGMRTFWHMILHMILALSVLEMNYKNSELSQENLTLRTVWCHTWLKKKEPLAACTNGSYANRHREAC